MNQATPTKCPLWTTLCAPPPPEPPSAASSTTPPARGTPSPPARFTTTTATPATLLATLHSAARSLPPRETGSTPPVAPPCSHDDQLTPQAAAAQGPGRRAGLALVLWLASCGPLWGKGRCDCVGNGPSGIRRSMGIAAQASGITTDAQPPGIGKRGRGPVCWAVGGSQELGWGHVGRTRGVASFHT